MELYIPTGNEVVSLPKINEETAAIESVSFLYMAQKGMIELRGNSTSPLMMPFVQQILPDGRSAELALTELGWHREHDWIPQMTARVGDIRIDMTVLADSDILRAGGIANRNNVREVDNDEFMQEFLKKLVRMRKHVYLLTGTDAQLSALRQAVCSYEENLRIAGSYSLEELAEQGYDEDYLVNEINVETPNVIISNIGSPQREAFFEANHMNGPKFDPCSKKHAKNHAPLSNGAQLQQCLIFRTTAGFGTLHMQVAGLHRAVPSTTLDKVFQLSIPLYQLSSGCRHIFC